MNRAVRDGCYGVVLVWGVVWLVAMAPDGGAIAEPERVRVEMATAPEPAPVARPPVAVPAATPLAAGDVAAGEPWLDASGAFPVLSARYDGLPSFASYATQMQRLGGRFAVVRRRSLVGHLDLATGAISEGPPPGAFSPRARDYSDEPALSPWTRRVRQQFGADAEVMLLVPRDLDAALFAAIARSLAARGESPQGFRELEGRYERGPAGSLRFRLERGRRLDGPDVAFSWVFDLSSLGEGVRG